MEKTILALILYVFSSVFALSQEIIRIDSKTGGDALFGWTSINCSIKDGASLCVQNQKYYPARFVVYSKKYEILRMRLSCTRLGTNEKNALNDNLVSDIGRIFGYTKGEVFWETLGSRQNYITFTSKSEVPIYIQEIEIVFGTELISPAGDINKDGSVDVTDVSSLIDMVIEGNGK